MNKALKDCHAKKCVGFYGLLVFLWALPTFAKDAVWLQKMAAKAQSVNYIANLVYQSDLETKMVQVTHCVRDGEQSIRLVNLDNDLREVHLRDGELMCLLPKQKLAVKWQSDAQGLPLLPMQVAGWDNVSTNYTLRFLAESRVANHVCRQILLTPKMKDRYVYRLCVDETSGVILHSQTETLSGQRIDQLLFTRFERYDSLPETALQPAFETDSFKHIVHPSPAKKVMLKDLPLQADTMPEGFVIKSVQQAKTIQGEEQWQILYTDGLAMVSVFLSPLSNKQSPLQGRQQTGVTNTYVHQSDRYRIVAMGNVPTDLLQRISESMREN